MTGDALIDAQELTRMCTESLRIAGVDAGDAAAAARILVEADMMGIPTHGVDRLPGYIERIRSGGVDAAALPRLERCAPSVALVDGANALGAVVGTRALAAAMDIARETGLAYVGCRNSNHFGALSPYAQLACEAGFVLVAGTNASTTIAPWGGAEARIGNNPLCIAAPCPDGRHFMLDMAMSVAARGKIRVAQREGRSIPEGWALDAQGRPTTDPAQALAGFLAPIGAYKGSGLAMGVDLLAGVLSGARFLTEVSSWVENPDDPQRLGHFFVAIDPERVLGREAFAAALTRFRMLIEETPPSDAKRPVLLPGDLAHARRQEALARGVRLPSALLARLRELAQRA